MPGEMVIEAEKEPKRSPDVWLRWITGGLLVAIVGLLGVVWQLTTGEITDLKVQTSVLQTRVDDLRVSMTDLTRRVSDLVDALNAAAAARGRSNSSR